MKKPRSVLVLLLLGMFAVSLVVVSQDVPDTPYDESEPLPYETTPLFSTAAPQSWGRNTQAELSCDSPLRFNFSTKRCSRRSGRHPQPLFVPDSLIIRDRAFRC